MNFQLIDGKSVHLIGDPHMGRAFMTGVPIHRRGDREKRQLARFKAELSTPCDFNIMVGDLLDHPNVGYGIVVAVAETYLEAARNRPATKFIAMAGNHDLPRNIGVIGAFDAFEKMVAHQGNIQVVRKPMMMAADLLVLPWEWGVSTKEQVEDVSTRLGTRPTACVMHCDLQSYGGDDSHMAPIAELKALGIARLYSGHYHIAGDYDGVICTGSMEPYSHAEDLDANTYVTLSLAEATDGRDLSQKCVRVILEENEELPVGLDCFALTPLKAKVETEEIQAFGKVKAFDWQERLQAKLATIDPEVRSFIDERLTG